MESGRHRHLCAHGGLAGNAGASSALRLVPCGLHPRRADGCAGRLVGQKNRDGQRVWRKAGQYGRPCVLRRPAAPAFPVLRQALPAAIWYAVAAVVLVRLVSYGAAAVKYHRFAFLHTWLNKLTGGATFLLPYALALSSGVTYSWFVCALALAASLE